MAQIIQFIPKREAGALKNVNAFINEAQGWNVFGDNVDWDARRWDMIEHAEYRASKAQAIVWTDFDTTQHNHRKVPLLQQPYLDFAKAYITYTQGIRPTKTYPNTLYAMRALERALCDRFKKPCITKVDPIILNAAQKLLYDKDKTDHKKQVAVFCNELQRLSCFLNEQHMLRSPFFVWKHSVKTYDPSKTIGEDFKKYRAEKLPTDTCIYALADIYNTTKDSRYKLATAVALLLFSSPSRVGEVLTLENECLIHNHQGSPGALGIRWFPEKGADPFIKSVKPSWRELVVDAVATIQEITNEARWLVKWYQENPEKVFLPEGYNHLRQKEYVTSEEAVKILNTSIPGFRGFLKRFSVKKKKNGQQSFYLFSDIEQAIMSKIPDGFPYRLKDQSLKYSESLFVVPMNFFRGNSNIFSKVMFEPVFNTHLAALYGTSSHISMFERLGMFEPDGSKISFPSHSARHWNETTSEYGFVDQNVRAAYAGRKKVDQNIWYSHADKIITSRKALTIRDQSDVAPSNVDKGIGVYSQPEVLSVLAKKEINTTDDLFNEVKADVTNAGFCLLGLDQTCKKLHDHYLCSDHLYIKGDTRLKSVIPFEIEKLESDNREWYKTANGDKNPLVIRNKQILQVLNSIMDILDDPQIPKGSFFRLASGKDYSKTRVIYYEKNKKFLSTTKDGAIPLIKVGELCLNI